MNLARPLLLVLTLLVVSNPARSETPFDADGWVTWRVAAVANRPDWCCYRWSAGDAQRLPCDLSRSDSHTGATDARKASGGEVQLWARVEQGRIDRLETLSPDCVVRDTVTWHDLGLVTEAESLAWLRRNTPTDHRRQHELIAAIAAHAGDASSALLGETARSGDTVELRRTAIFWIGQLRIGDSREVLIELMHSDTDPAIREHAIFSYAHSPAGDRTEVLIGLVENPQRPMQDRKRALFWLAERGDGVDYIQQLLLGNARS